MPEPRKRDFQDVLTDLDEGRLHQQLTELWPKVVRAVVENNKPGSITLTLSASTDRGQMVNVSAKVSTKLPAPSTGATLFYTDEAGNTTRNDPKQLPLKNVTPLKQPS